MDESENKEEAKSEAKGEEIDQDKLAEEWAKALAEEEEDYTRVPWGTCYVLL